MWNIAYPVFCFSEPMESMLAAISRAKACALSDSNFLTLALSEEGSNEKLSTVLVTRLVRWL